MSDFSHVENDTLRAVLEGSIAPMSNTLWGCVEITLEAWTADCSQTLVSYSVIAARHDAVDDAVDAYNNDDIDQCLAALRRYWSI